MKSKIDKKQAKKIDLNSKNKTDKKQNKDFITKLIKYALPILALLIIIFGVWFIFIHKSDKNLFSDALRTSGGLNGRLTITYPHNNTIFPPEIASPSFHWKDPDNDTYQWLVIVEENGKIRYISDYLDEKKWKPDSSDWEDIKSMSEGKDVTVNIIGINKDEPGKIYNGGKIQFTISKDSVGAPIFFRAVPLPFGFAVDNLPTISWRLGDVSHYSQPKIMLTNLPVCGNCHSFSSDGKTLGMDVDYANDKGAYFITNISKHTDITFDKIMTWNDYKRDEKEYTFGLLSRVSPDGRYVLSTVKDRSIFVRINKLDYSQLFFPIKGIIAIYDIIKKTFSSLQGADDKAYCQSDPIWSPDGKTVLFTKAPVYHSALAEQSKDIIIPTEYAKEFIEGRQDYKYDIYQVPFDYGKGGVAVPLPGASNNGMSNYFPKYSPDGKWIVFTQAINFMLLQPDAKLYIMPAQGGTPRLMNCNNPGTMNSWHSWSPNGKWIVFSSKATGPYTQLYLTHIDENGNDSPSILLENMTIRNRAVNIPEFINTKYDYWESLDEKFVDNDVYTFERGKEKLRLKDYGGALKELDRAITLNPKDVTSLNLRALVKFELGKGQEALEDYDKVVALNPKAFFVYSNRANAKALLKDYEGAISDLDMAIKLNPQSSVEYNNRGEAKFDIGDFNGAINDLTTSLQFNPKNDKAMALKATAKYNLGDYKGAVSDFDKALELNPKDSLAFFKRGLSNLQLGIIDQGCKDLKEALKLGYKEAEEYINKFCR